MPQLVSRLYDEERAFFFSYLFTNERNRPKVDEIRNGNYYTSIGCLGNWESLNFGPYGTGNHRRDSVCRSGFLCRAAHLQKLAKQICVYYRMWQMRRHGFSKDRSSDKEEGALILTPKLSFLPYNFYKFQFRFLISVSTHENDCTFRCSISLQKNSW